MQVALRKFFAIMPFLFGIGFIAPLVAQSMAALHVAPPWGLSGVSCGLLIGAPWGLYATWRGRWI